MIHMMKSKIVAVGIAGVIVASFFLEDMFLLERKETVPTEEAVDEVSVPEPSAVVLVEEQKPVISLPISFLIPGVPFTVQAPLGQWQDPIYQDACEEASLAMARAWVQGKVFTKQGVTEEIQKLTLFEKKKFGQSVDTSIEDTAWLLENYYDITTGSVERGVTIESIKQAVASEKIVIVPTDGRKLKNPNFKQPGPTRHMLVIVGYESEKKIFIVNDPGTRKGEGYRYDEDVLYDALIDYETGNHVPLTSTDKVMLTIGKE